MTRPYAAVVVLHESRDELSALLRSLEPIAGPRLIVVDTGADDGGAQLAREHGAEVIERRDNPGFGAATNLGLERVSEDVAVLLNPDVEAIGDSLPRLAAIAAEHDGLHAPRLLNRDGSVQRSAHPLPGTLGALLPAVIHPPLLPAAIRDRAEPYRSTRARSVGWAIAACLAARTDTLRRFPFDPATHLYAEDMELCLRARDAGVPTVYHPQLILRHAGGHSLYRQGEPHERLAARRREAIEATRGGRARRLDDAAQLLTFAIRAAVKRPNQRERAQLNALLKQRDPGGPGSN
ncbi:glycosyltransferase family 2 protein [Candidatus Solirubrobacter pratensis]|uniref:glycosyltransferase family 2 protein n=1 Tax=Candidatus Solirubrobacter pratensis TaxID=1298857 RepID=UPI0003FA1D9B|nr:glycosyltransferase family 2 protein [Candidatus Solirubrobacter pratensis]